ncbi:class I SAM-dependent methyltransferase [Patescibacteria group bacterium]|nr:class I SAM-dependent methyltransferase [Patescibacteria group bacterium]
MDFNKIVIKFNNDMKKKAYQRYCKELKITLDYLLEKRIVFRLDGWISRSWEYCHLLGKIDNDCKIILDFGGGNSLFSYHLALLGHKVFMLDVDKQSVDIFNENIKKLKLTKRAKGIKFDGLTLPFSDNYFDLITFISVIEHIPFKQRKKIFEELRRVLKPNKNLLMTFDYGKGSRIYGDPIISVRQIYRNIIMTSGLELEGNNFSEPRFAKKKGLPVKVLVVDKTGMDWEVVQYSFGACCLVKRLEPLHKNRQKR